MEASSFRGARSAIAITACLEAPSGEVAEALLELHGFENDCPDNAWRADYECIWAAIQESRLAGFEDMQCIM